jgi:hypothetical protein
MAVRRFALIWGLAFLLFGVLGFVPGVNHMHHGGTAADQGVAPADNDLIVKGPGHGDLLGLFHVNVLHNAVHLLFGVLGVAAYGRFGAARAYARFVAVSYFLLAIMGMLPFANMDQMFGLVPIEGNDIWLHLLLAIPAAYFGFIRRYDTDDRLGTTGATTTTTVGTDAVR